MSPMYYEQPSFARLIAVRDLAAQAVFRAELAVHDAERTGVAEWVDAAYVRLHRAVLRYESASAELTARQAHAAAA